MKDDCPRCGGSFPAHAFNGHPCVGRGEVHPDLAREIESLLPCPHEPPCEDARVIQDACPSCNARPAILTWAERKLDEAKADGELLAKVEKLLSDDFGIRLDICAGGVFVRQLQVHGLETRARAIAPTLAEALRKLVESEP